MAKRTTKPTTKQRAGKSSLAAFQTSADLRTAVLIVSLVANLFVVCLWITLQLTNYYDHALMDFFINR